MQCLMTILCFYSVKMGCAGKLRYLMKAVSFNCLLCISFFRIDGQTSKMLLSRAVGLLNLDPLTIVFFHNTDITLLEVRLLVVIIIIDNVLVYIK
jgi:hypothetical protein